MKILLSLTLLAQFVHAATYVISDIDDTVKQSHALDKRRMILRHVTGRVPSFEHLVSIFHEIHTYEGHQGNSPEWLYLSKLNGTYNVEKWVNRYNLPSGLVKQRTIKEYFKLKGMLFKIMQLEDFVKRVRPKSDDRILLFGDNGEQDPTVYKIFREQMVPHVEDVQTYIRDIRGQLPLGIKPEVQFLGVNYFLSEMDLIMTPYFQDVVSGALAQRITLDALEDKLVPRYVLRTLEKDSKLSSEECIKLISNFLFVKK